MDPVQSFQQNKSEWSNVSLRAGITGRAQRQIISKILLLFLFYVTYMKIFSAEVI